MSKHKKLELLKETTLKVLEEARENNQKAQRVKLLYLFGVRAQPTGDFISVEYVFRKYDGHLVQHLKSWLEAQPEFVSMDSKSLTARFSK